MHDVLAKRCAQVGRKLRVTFEGFISNGSRFKFLFEGPAENSVLHFEKTAQSLRKNKRNCYGIGMNVGREIHDILTIWLSRSLMTSAL